MKTLGEAAMELPWLAPSALSMTALAKSSLPAIWPEVRSDPGIVLLLARALESPAQTFPSDVAVLESLLRHQAHFQLGFVDWNQPGPASVHRVCSLNASLTSQLAQKVGIDERHGWIAGFLAPLGWLALTAADPAKISFQFELLRKNPNALAWQQSTWGLDHTALARRLCRSWRIPSWLSAVIANLGLPAGIAERLGAPARLFQVVQLACSLLHSRGEGWGLPISTSAADLLTTTGLQADDVGVLADVIVEAEQKKLHWESPAKCPLLADLLELALENRRQNDAAWIERLQHDLDCLQQALVSQCVDEKSRIQSAKLSALAEFAAGAGHEINNPLAVISGQAQYVLKQMAWLEVPTEEIENIGEYMEGLRVKVTPSLNKIIGQTQRIHSILTELMTFARPGKPKLQALSVRSLIQEVMHSCQGLAQQRRVRVVPAEILHDEILHADLPQARGALYALLRNAIEAAPVDGWAGIRIDKKNGHLLELIVEDNGSGPAAAIREHLFDPFFSGRSAGRGRGMGLPTAWRFARQHGGDVRFDGLQDGVTRFILTLPLAPIVAIPSYTTGNNNGRNGSHPAAESHAK